MKIRYTDRTPQDITKHKVQKDWASAIKVLKPFKTGFFLRKYNTYILQNDSVFVFKEDK